MTRFVQIGINNKSTLRATDVSIIDGQYFTPIPSTHEIRFRLTKKRYTNPQGNMRLPYQILSDTIITEFI